MKKILSLAIISSLFFISSIVSAQNLAPSLTTQMIKQERINKRNEVLYRVADRARKQKEKQDKILAQKNQRLIAKKVVQSAPTIIQNSSPTPLVISRPPAIVPFPTENITASNIPVLQNINMAQVRATWIGWYNSVRTEEGLGVLSYDSRLDITAYDWNQVLAKSKGANHHTRSQGDGYYNFSKIDNWFMTRGINPPIIGGSKHTENVGYGSYSCKANDCTDTLIRSIRSTFDFFMSEKGKSYDPHYRSIVQPNFSKIGLSVILVPNEQRYYLTVHYITK